MEEFRAKICVGAWFVRNGANALTVDAVSAEREFSLRTSEDDVFCCEQVNSH